MEHKQSQFCIILSMLWFVTVSLPVAVLLRICRVIDRVRYDPDNVVLYLDLSARWAERWPYSTTIGRAILLHPNASDDTIEHELVHVRQHEDLVFIAWLVGIAVELVTWNRYPWLAVGIWWSAGLWQLPMYVTSMLRHGRRNCYLDAEHERAAYAQTERVVTFEATYNTFLKRRYWGQKS